MSVGEIEEAIKVLPASEVAALAEWLVEYHHQRWDQQIAIDLESGNLDKLLDQVEAEYHGKTLCPVVGDHIG